MLGASRLVLLVESEFTKPVRKESRESPAVFKLSNKKLILLETLAGYPRPIYRL